MADEKQNVTDSRKHSAFIFIGLLFLTFGLYWQLRGNGFINYDDPYYVTGNKEIQRGLTKEGIAWAFGRLTGYGTYWHPVTWISHMIDCQLFGINPGPHHLVNAGIHAFNAALLFLLLKKLTGAVWRSAIVAALFAVHPLQVESVAWAAERKNVLSSLFFFLTIFSYAEYTRSRNEPPESRKMKALFWYAGTWLLFAVGLMCKPMLVTLPCVLLLLDFWPLKRFEKFDAKNVSRLVIEKIPFFILSVISSFITVAAHKQLDLVVSTDEFSLRGRLTNSLVAYGLYILKAFWPTRLAIYYPLPSSWASWQILLSLLLVIGLTFFAVRSFKQRPWFLFGWLWFLGTLVPTIGLVQVNDQAMADRFAYLPLVGIFLIVVWTGAEIFKRLRFNFPATAVLVSVVLLVLSATTWAQTKHWKSTETLFTHATQVTTGNYVAHNNLARELVTQGRMAEAIPHFEEVVKLKYYTAIAHNNIGIWKAMHGDMDGAIQSFHAALESDAKDVNAYVNMGLALLQKGNATEAVRLLNQALQLNPDHADAHNNLALALEQSGQTSEAEHHYREALRIQPEHSKAQYALGVLLLKQNKTEEARLHFSQALQAQPDFKEAQQALERVESAAK